METFMYLWFDICSFITKCIVRPIMYLIFIGPLLIEARTYIAKDWDGFDKIDAEEWFYTKSKVAKPYLKICDYFREIEY